MRRIFVMALGVWLFACSSRAASEARVRFEITLGDNLVTKPVSGRLLIFVTPNTSPMMFVQPSLPDINTVWVCAKEVTTFFPGQSIEVDPDVTSFPGPFSSMPPGNYQVMVPARYKPFVRLRRRRAGEHREPGGAAA